MYTPPAFRTDDLPALHAMMRAARLATLVTATTDGPIATPLPLLLAEDEGEYGVLYGHVARANPQWSTPATGPAIALFMGPDAYVSPGWYASKREHGKVVPTWNYTAVQAAGPIEFFDDPDRLRDVVTRLTDRHEAGRADRWAVSDAPDAFIAAQLRGIVGLRLPIARLQGKRKLSQNRAADDRAGVAEGLAASPDPADQAMAALIPR
ncbi:FMN-binding negative transcriptional regulator [Gluconacetobacter tumulisoli]|uniref:FMN-binding negative transcriptional regulator n=1 Tax=Gluconacetobacter tumulisoli TaxID=1286189 RepID=A0A7W4K5A4_9PROT|nr:FMN-binding negative transcriptional regulator [Gluconacetobacter tumulisoli]MBB2200669.1 FMN-binding negative transcriptional regulator [Gluconacetobacter tumulisoli]